MSAQPKPQPKLPAEMTITNGVISPDKIPIDNNGLVQFHVKGFGGKRFCSLMIYAVKYTDDGLAVTEDPETTAAPAPVPLGTIKIGS